ncbi:hypothetical protein V7055_22505, partial [Bacillus thuringiensis]
MFENKLLNFYKNRMSIWSLVFKPVRKRLICFAVIQLLALIALFFVSVYYADKSGETNLWFIGCFLGFEICLFFSFGFFIFKPAKIKLF